MAYYASDVDGTGGRLRDRLEDFRVRELEAVDLEPLDADHTTYDHLVVRATLRDRETNAFARELANRLGMSRERVAWAGMKDRRAVTTQLISLARVNPRDLPDLAGVDLEPVGRLGRALRFGDLAGNAFTVTVADPERPEQVEAVSACLREFAGSAGHEEPATAGTVGVPNYFGHQRFGAIRPVTHLVGRQIVQDDWEGAVMAYLGNPHDEEPRVTQEVRRFVEETRDWAVAADRFPSGLTFERTLCHRLAEADDESAAAFREALGALPWNLRRLFTHALQSEVFNRVLSRRFEAGLPFDRAVHGDVVCFVADRGGRAVPDPDRMQRVTTDRVETVNRHVASGRAFVTSPLVGTETEFADGRPGELERAVLGELDLERADFNLPEPYASTGTRRPVLVGTDPLIEREPLTLSFELPPGAYASVVCREYLKVGPRWL